MALLNPVSVNFCPWCGYPLGILANHTRADGEERMALSEQANAPMPPLAHHRMVHRTAPARMTLIRLLSLAGLTSLVLVGIIMTTFASVCAIAITP
jgi:hypothetical protein